MERTNVKHCRVGKTTTTTKQEADFVVYVLARQDGACHFVPGNFCAMALKKKICPEMQGHISHFSSKIQKDSSVKALDFMTLWHKQELYDILFTIQIKTNTSYNCIFYWYVSFLCRPISQKENAPITLLSAQMCIFLRIRIYTGQLCKSLWLTQQTDLQTFICVLEKVELQLYYEQCVSALLGFTSDDYSCKNNCYILES